MILGIFHLAFSNVAMPDVLWGLQGRQEPLYTATRTAHGQQIRRITSLTLVRRGAMTPAQYDRTVSDIVNFLAYLSRPYTLESERIGRWMIGLLVLLTVLAYLLKREYWKDVH